MNGSAISAWVSLPTPERVELRFRLAGPGSRLGAYGIDLTLRALLFYVFVLALHEAHAPRSGWPTGALFVVLFALEWGYGAAFETVWRGQTPGKRALGLRVVRTDGRSIRLREAWLRNLFRAADFFPLLYGAGLVTSIATTRMQRIGDIVASTMVIREPERAERHDGRLDRSATMTLPPQAPNVATRRTWELVEALRRRRSCLSRARLDEIAAGLATSLASRQPSPAARKLAAEEPSAFLFHTLFGSSRARPVETE